MKTTLPKCFQEKQATVYLHTVQTLDPILPCIQRIPQLHFRIESKFLLRLLLCILGLFLPLNLLLPFTTQIREVPRFESAASDIKRLYLQRNLSKTDTCNILSDIHMVGGRCFTLTVISFFFHSHT